MVYLQNWQEFELAVKHLYFNEPFKTRYEIKHRPSDGDVILKVTDDVTCLKFRAQSTQHVKKMDALTSKFMAWSVLPSPSSMEDLEDPMSRVDLEVVTKRSTSLNKKKPLR
eukprot:Protomagalhaensia_sp_Gyna_25__5919@NODE_900_length_2441_cov_49_981682_g710_i0_p2_GENE_NODE_900_length_2441_cov_49_981682_g710_i0NODE_900_length_2441_cov_49_981682_g710_i0_p2_ORF_typecomplete_len111_score11_96SRP921/PF05486_12/2_9e18_NODE_900_length_2441_cov_49_981682_g710_i0529861